MKKELLIAKREKAKQLHEKGFSINQIAKKLVSNWRSVNKWVNMEEVTEDNRGWKKGKMRSYTQEQKRRVIKIRNELRKEESYFFGSDVIEENYKIRYPDEETPSQYFINKSLREENLTMNQKKERVKDGSKHLKYPKDKLDKTGKVVLGIDFVGPRFISDQTEPVHFMARKYIRPLKYGRMTRIESQTTDEALRVLLEDFKTLPVPDVIRLDNDRAFGVGSFQERTIGSFLKVLLNLGVTPIFSAFSQPWNNGATEGFNSMFSRKMWNKLKFSDEEEIDVEIKGFNFEYQKYKDLVANNDEEEWDQERALGEEYQLPEKYKKGLKKDSDMQMYWLRVVKENPEAEPGQEKGQIKIFKEEIALPKTYVNQYTLNRLDVLDEKLYVMVEGEEGSMKTIKTRDFPLANANWIEEQDEEEKRQ